MNFYIISLPEIAHVKNKTLLIMKLTFVLTISVLLQVNATGYAQKITLSEESVTLKKVIKEIRKQTKYDFFYDASIIQNIQHIDINVKNATIQQVLDECLKGQPLTYSITDKFVVIKEKLTQDLRLQANVIDVTGKVTDEKGQSLPGASIKVKGANTTTSTDANGEFILRGIDDKSVIVITYLGFVTQELPLNSQRNINIVLKEDLRNLGEVVVIGYGTQKREDIIGSVSQVTADQLANRPVTKLSHAITGQVPGLTVTQSTGQPGVSAGTIRLRGVGSFGASPDIMVIVDGVPTGLAVMNNIDPNTVESISILKDASSAAIYGARAANGVILITTKTGKEGRTIVSYNGYTGIQTPTALPEFLDSWEYATAYNEAYGTQAYSPEDIMKFKDGRDPDKFPNTRFLDEIIENSTQSGHNIAVSGGTAANQYNLSLGYMSQDGLVANNSFNRYNGRLNMKTAISPKLDLTSRLAFISTERKEPGANVITIMDEAVRMPSNLVGIYSNGMYGEGLSLIGTPISRIARDAFLDINDQHLNGNLRLDYKPIDGLKLSFISSYIQENGSSKSFIGTQNIGVNSQILLGPSSLMEQSNVARNYTLQGLADYNKRIGKHEFNILLGYSFEEFESSDISAYRNNFPGNDLTVLNVGAPDNQQANGTGAEWAIESQFARINYNYSNKYLIEGVVRRDGSSRFPTSNKYAIFPSVAVGWRISQEKFIKNNLSWISELKIKASRGVLGNQSIGNYPYQNTFGVVGAGPGSNVGTNYSFGGSIYQGVKQSVLADPNLHWESTRTTDVGVDFGIFKNKLTGSATYFHRYTYDILYSPSASVSNVLGLGLSAQNTGRLRNTGWEFTLNHQNKVGKVSFNIGSNFSIINNEVLDLGVGNINQPNGMIGNGSSLFIGYPMQIYYGFIADGLFVDQADINSWPSLTAINPTPKPGDIRYKDLSGPNGVPDGKVDNTFDRTILGNQIPKYTYGFNLGADYAGIDFSVMLQGVAGVNGYLGGNQGFAFNNGANIQRWQYEERWNEQNPDRNATYPRLQLITTAGNGNTPTSSFWSLDGSYLRIKNAQIGYSLPKKVLQNVKISNARFYLSGENLHTFSNYRKGWDPEITGNNTYYPMLSNYTLGINLTF